MAGGETGIRTLDTLRYTRFPSVRLQPLGHLSAVLQTSMNLTQLAALSKAPTRLNDSRSLSNNVLFYNRRRFQFHRNSLHQVAPQRGAVAPVNLPPMIDGNQNILPRNNIRQIVATIRIRLVLL